MRVVPNMAAIQIAGRTLSSMTFLKVLVTA